MPEKPNRKAGLKVCGMSTHPVFDWEKPTVVYCNYKQITSSYIVITERNMSHSLPNVGLNCLFKTLKKHVIFKIVTVIRLSNSSKLLKDANYSKTTL